MKEEKVLDAVYVHVDDWDGLYIDGKLVGEGDSMNLPYLLNGTLRFSHRENDADKNWIDNVGGFPETLDELIDNEYMWDEDNREDEDDDDDN